MIVETNTDPLDFQNQLVRGLVGLHGFPSVRRLQFFPHFLGTLVVHCDKPLLEVLIEGDAPLVHLPYYSHSEDGEVSSVWVVPWDRRGEIDCLEDPRPDCMRYQICFLSKADLDVTGNLFS